MGRGQPLNASFSAKFIASVTGSQAAGVGIVAISGVITVVSIVYGSTAGLWVGAGGFILGAAHLFFVNTRWGRKPEISTVAVTEPNGSKISVLAPSSAAALMLLREVIQGRKPLPNPAGKVTGNPADKSALQAYTAEESAAAAAKIQNDIQEFERKVAADAMEKRAEALPLPLGNDGGAVKLD
jgi:hypothetical protein